jgi:acetyltransferase-like isoleucine patch superfamily enzyme
MKALLKTIARAVAVVLITPALISFQVRRALFGGDRAIMGSTQALALVPGTIGQYVRTAFLRCTLRACAPTVVVEFGTIFSSADAALETNVYIGPMCHIGRVHIERDVLIAAGVHVPSGPDTHGIGDVDRPIREQPGAKKEVRIGAGSWIGSAAVVLADVGPACVVGAGAVVTKPIPGFAVAAGVPAVVIRTRAASTA